MKSLITLDKAGQPFGFPQLNEVGRITASLVQGPLGNNSVQSSSYALTASFALNGGGTAATIDEINLGEIGALIIQPEQLEQSKHSTHNIFNFLNFT